MAQYRTKTCGASVCAVLIIVIALIASAISSLDANEVGLVWNGVTLSLNTDTVYESGTYFLGANVKFLKFPKTQQTIKYAFAAGDDGDPIPCRTKDGLPITVSFAFNYRLVTTPSELAKRYLDFGEMDEIDLAYQRSARNVVRVVASQYAAFSFFFDRASIQADLTSKMNTELQALGANVESLQLLDIGFPVEFNDARTRQESAAQQVTQAQNELQVAVINTVTRVGRAQQEAALIVSRAGANAEAATFRNGAAEQSLVARYTAERQSYAALASSLGLNANELLAYIWIEASRDRLTSGGASGSGRNSHETIAMSVPGALLL